METATANPSSPPAQTEEGRGLPMFSGDETAGFRTRWEAVQTGFVDEPRKAVEEADSLVAQVINGCRRCSQTNAQRSSISGIVAIRFRLRIFESPCGSIVRSSTDCCLSSRLLKNPP
jgi:hypothetical protein